MVNFDGCGWMWLNARWGKWGCIFFRGWCLSISDPCYMTVSLNTTLVFMLAVFAKFFVWVIYLVHFAVLEPFKIIFFLFFNNHFSIFLYWFLVILNPFTVLFCILPCILANANSPRCLRGRPIRWFIWKLRLYLVGGSGALFWTCDQSHGVTGHCWHYVYQRSNLT